MNFAIILILVLDAATFGPGNRFHLERSKDSFGMRSHGIVETLGAGRTKFYPLPQSTAEKYNRLRARRGADRPIAPERYERQEVIGPYQIEGGKLWFGNGYYDGEGIEASAHLATSIRQPANTRFSLRSGAVRNQRHPGGTGSSLGSARPIRRGHIHVARWSCPMGQKDARNP